MEFDYRAWCQSWHKRYGVWPAGHSFYWDIPFLEQPPKAIVCLPTKDDWQNRSRIEWIRQGLDSMVAHMLGNGHRSIAMPALGCGLGGLDFEQVYPVIEKAFFNTNLYAVVYASKQQITDYRQKHPDSKRIAYANEKPEFEGAGAADCRARAACLK
ncbi:MAG: macro domain-containing protein [Acidobacteriaceae bacterium]|nr:macro domain-containing protein [Acidobacteriaceae bacterium]